MAPNPTVHTIERVFLTGGSGFVGRNLIRRLVAEGHPVRALARSPRSAEVVAELGAEPIRGELLDRAALAEGMEGCDTVFHCAAAVDDWCRGDAADRINVDGTDRVLQVARQHRVATVVHVSTEAVLVGGPTLLQADESWPRPTRPLGVYPRTKGWAEEVCERAAADGQRVVIVRPRYIWGADDSTLLPRLVEAAEQGLLRWMDGGHYPSSTCHVANCVEGMLLAATRGRSGQAYFLTDGEPVDFRDFVSALLRTRGVEPPTGTVPGWLMAAAATCCEALWILPLPGRPPLTRSAVAILGPCTVRDDRARTELGYRPPVSVDEGLAALDPSTPT